MCKQTQTHTRIRGPVRSGEEDKVLHKQNIMITHDHKIVSLLTKIHYFSPSGLKYTLPKI